MRAAYETLDAIVGLLRDSQAPASTLPFSISGSITINDFQPGDFTVDGQPTQDGVYIYFDKTNFDSSMGDVGTQSHTPVINLDMYTSVPATRNTTTNEITFSEFNADRAIRSMTIQLYDALKHASFLRLLENKLVSPTWKVWFDLGACEKIGVLRLPKSKQSIACQRLTCIVSVTEKHNQATGVPLAERKDHITPHRVDDSDDNG